MAGVEFDYVVVGAGAAGCVLAGRLAAATARPSVLLLEYGGPARNPLLRIPRASTTRCAATATSTGT